ncbi:hypothetical protein ISS40_01085 [Candidatus Bathyarchaeota archaeon]|nr:hypothetical protein [Candidatus Bathyarchaeota archaeon]
MGEVPGAQALRRGQEGIETPTPDWARCHVEIHEAPGWLDDCFRSSLWTKFQSAASESFTPDSGISGDLAEMAVTEGGTPSGCGYRIDVSSLALSTDDYPRLRVRLRGRGTTPRYKLEVEYTDTSSNGTGWLDAPVIPETLGIELITGKTVKYVKLYAKSSTASSTAYIDYDYAVLGKNPPLIPNEIMKLVVDLQTTVRVSSLNMKILNDVMLGVTERRYLLNEATGGHAYDLSKNRGHAHLVNTAWSAGGKEGYCLLFNGSSSRMQTGYTKTIPATGALTISFWLKAPPGATGVICGFGSAYGGGGGWNRIQFNFDANKLRLYVRDDAGNTRQYTSTSIVCSNEWNLITGIIDPAGDKTELWVNDYYDGGATGTLGTLTLVDELTWGCLHNQGVFSDWAVGYVDEPMIYEKALVRDEIYHLLTRDPPSGAARASTGNIVMVYLAAHNETLVRKIMTARIIDRVTSGEPGEPALEIVGESLDEIMYERTFTYEYANPTLISTIIDAISDQSLPEVFHQIDATSRSIVNKFRLENVWSLVQKLAETSKFASGETGANFYIDPGGALRFKKYGAFNSTSKISDGSDGYPANIFEIGIRETMKGQPRLVNDVRVVIFEEENDPKDEDSWTEAADSWSSPDPTDANFPASDTGDKQRGTASIKFQTTNPGSQYRMRHVFSEVDISGMDRLKFWFKYGAGLSPENLEVRMQKGLWIWTWDYYLKTGLSVPAADTWVEYDLDISSFSKGGNPGRIVDHLQIRPYRAAGDLGVGGFKVDKLRFARAEKAGTDSDATSQTNYGKRELRLVDKTITTLDYAGYVAENIVEHRKNPLVVVAARVQGRAQTGFRPPEMTTVTSLKDGLTLETFQIQRARHSYIPEQGYFCDVELVAAKKPDGTYEPKVCPVQFDITAIMAGIRARARERELNALRKEWM